MSPESNDMVKFLIGCNSCSRQRRTAFFNDAHQPDEKQVRWAPICNPYTCLGDRLIIWLGWS